jgi:hypothetical protein
MFQPEIPENNLSVYLQQYEVNILNTNKLRPCNDQSCVSSGKGCCPDNVTPVFPSGDCPIGGCAGTQFGCCPYSTEAKVDQEGPNCGTIAGSVLYNTVGAIPSNEVGDRVWELHLSGSLKPGVDTYYIVYDFQKVNYKYKDKITFENAVTGTFNTCGRVLDANRYLTKEFCDETQTLTIIVDTKKWGFRLKKEAAFSYTINVDDSSNLVIITSADFGISYTLRLNYTKGTKYWYPTLSPPSSAPTFNTSLQYTTDNQTVNIDGQFQDPEDIITNDVRLKITGTGDINNQKYIEAKANETYPIPDDNVILDMSVTSIDEDLQDDYTQGNVYLYCTFSAPSS